MQKWGAEFVSPWHAVRSQTFEFAEGWNKALPFAYQVRRSQFDEILIRRAADSWRARHRGLSGQRGRLSARLGRSPRRGGT